MESAEMPRSYPTRGKELIFAACILCSCLLLCNFIIYGGLNLGFAIAAILTIACSVTYLLLNRCRLTVYSSALLVLSLVIAAGFARSDDGFVKFVLASFLLVSVNLALCLLARQNRRDPGTAGSLLDAGFTLFHLGFGELPQSYHGLVNAMRFSGPLGQKAGAIALGAGISLPILVILIPLLMRSDAAFEGLIDLLPDFSASEFFCTVFFGFLLSCILYTRSTALKHYQPTADFQPSAKKGLSPLTVNTVLGVICLVYCAYLFSQLAYFVGGLSGFLPEEYTLAQYARRGFFEMACLCAINLGLIALSIGLCGKAAAPKSSRFLCLFLGVVTEFLVVSASAKMFLYIGSYGLTRLRVLTQVVMLFLALTTALVCIRLFVPKLPYMKTVILSGLILGALVLWLDVDTLVARYNVDAYLSGRTETIDMAHMGSLGNGAVPHIARLAEEAPDAPILWRAQDMLKHRADASEEDFRSWNYAGHLAAKFLPAPEVSGDTAP